MNNKDLHPAKHEGGTNFSLGDIYQNQHLINNWPVLEMSLVGPVFGVLCVGPLLSVQSKSSPVPWVNWHSDLLSKLQNTTNEGTV